MKITVDVRDKVSADYALSRIGMWYGKNRINPKENPMSGVAIYADGMVIFKRPNRKSDCFVAYYDASKDKSKEESAPPKPTKATPATTTRTSTAATPTVSYDEQRS